MREYNLGHTYCAATSSETYEKYTRTGVNSSGSRGRICHFLTTVGSLVAHLAFPGVDGHAPCGHDGLPSQSCGRGDDV